MVQFKVDEELCIQCEECVNDCPAGVIAMGDFPQITNEEGCFKCQHCMAVCPSAAISILNRYPDDSTDLKGNMPDPDQLAVLIKGRRSIRRYKKQDLPKSLIDELLEVCQVVPAINQFEISPFNFHSRKKIIEYCLSQSILVEAYSPLTKGYKLNDPDLIKIGSKYSKSPAQILIRWALQHQLIVLPKSSHIKRIQENADVFDFAISEEDMMYLDGLDQNLVTSWDPTNSP